MKRSLLVLSVSAVGLTWGCRDTPTVAPVPTAPSGVDALTAHPSFALAGTGGPTGAIFTTVPDGSIVNENVRYRDKREVYLDGGPRGGSPQTAAGLDDGLYVFQITDPSGKYLLSMDPAMCRVIEVRDGVIKRLVPATELGFASNGYKVGNTTYPCHVADAPNPPATAQRTDFGPSGRHDTNVDVDYGAQGAIVVQMMPYGTTPNPGGVYKAWVSTLGAYQGKGGSLASVPSQARGKDAQPCPDFCAAADPGFGPPRNLQKTDNFKVQEEARLRVVKVNDVNGNGVRDDGEPTLPDWPVAFVQSFYDGTPDVIYDQTTATRTFVPGEQVVVCEAGVEPWHFSFATGGTPVSTPSVLTGSWYCVQVTVGSAGSTVEIAFGNWQPGKKTGYKFHDLNMNAAWDQSTEPGLADWTINLTGTDGRGNPVSRSATTVAGGAYKFEDLPPGSYTVAEACPADWYQSYPAPSAGCGSGVHAFTIVSGPPGAPDVHANNNFGNYRKIPVSGYKISDLNGNGHADEGDVGLQGWEIHLFGTDGAGAAVHLHTLTDATGRFSFPAVDPGSYRLCESAKSGWVQTYPTSGVDCTTHAAGGGAPEGASAGTGFGYSLTLKSGDAATVGFDFLNHIGQGCTPGFWQGGNGSQLWDATTIPDPDWVSRIGGSNPFTQATPFNGFFQPAPELVGLSMLDIVGTGGTEVEARKAARSLIAAYLNRSAGLAYPYELTQLVGMWESANNNGTGGTTRLSNLLSLHTLLDAANNLHNNQLCQ